MFKNLKESIKIMKINSIGTKNGKLEMKIQFTE